MAGLLIFPDAGVMLNDLAGPRQVSLQPCAMGSTDKTVYVAVPTVKGQWVIATFDLALLLTAAEAFIHTHGDPRCRTTPMMDTHKGD